MIRKQYKFLMIYIVLILLTFTGCWDYKDINNKIIVLAVGVDYENGKYMFTSENTLLQKGSIQSEKGSEQNRMYYFSAEGEDFEAVRSKINAKKNTGKFFRSSEGC